MSPTSPRRRRTHVVLVVLVATLSWLTARGPANASTQVPTVAATPLGIVEGTNEASGIYELHRDEGLSVALDGGQSLWIFGDTVVHYSGTKPAGAASFFPSSTAAIGPTGPGVAPTGLAEIQVGVPPSAGGAAGPHHFLPLPGAVYVPDHVGKVCTVSGQGYPARWPTGAARIPGTTKVFVTFFDVCALSRTSYPVEGWGYAIFDTATNTFSVPATEVILPRTTAYVLPWTRRYISPIFESPTELVLFTSTCLAGVKNVCTSGAVNVTTINPTVANLRDIAHAPQTATMTAPGTRWRTHLLSVAYYPAASGPSRFIALTQPDTTGLIDVVSSGTPTGPWTTIAHAQLPGCAAIFEASVGTTVCYAIVGHPEQSGNGHLVVSYYLPTLHNVDNRLVEVDLQIAALR